MDLIVTLVILCIFLGIAYWIIMQIPGIGGHWIVNVVFGLVALLLVMSIFTGTFPVIKLRG